MEQSSIVSDGKMQPRRGTFSETTVKQERYGRPSVQGTISRKASFYRETRFTPTTETGHSPVMHASSGAVETRQFSVPPRPTYSPASEQLFQIERLHREEKDRILAFMKADLEDCKHFYEEQFEDLQTENKRLLLQVSDSDSRITLLQIKLEAHDDSYSGSSPQLDNVDVTLTTNIATITTTITTVTRRIDQWKRQTVAKNNNQIIISSKELELLSSELSTTSSQMAELQQHYGQLLSNFGSVRRELQVTLSRSNEKDRTSASLTAEVAQWRITDVKKGEEITAARRENEMLRHDLSAASARTAELQQRYDAQLKELASVRSQLQAKALLVEEGDRTIASFTAEIAEWKQSDAAKTEQIADARRDYDMVQTDFSTLSSQTAELQKRYNAQSKEIISIRSKLHARESLLEEKHHAVTSLSDELAQAKRESNLKTEQIETARRDVEQLRDKLSSSSTRFADLQKRYEAQLQEVNSLRDQLHEIEALYPDGTDQAAGKPSKQVVADQIRRALEKKNKQLTELGRDLATSTSQNAELQKSYEVVSKEVSALRDELKVKASQYEGTITSLTAQVDRWKSADAAKAAQITTILKDVERIQHDLSTSTSQLTELQGRYDAQSREFTDVRSQLQGRISSEEGKDRTIASLNAQVEEWKRADTNKTEQIATTLRQVEKFQHDLSTSTSQLAELKSRYEAQARELTTVRSELKTVIVSSESKDHTIASLTAEVEQWKGAGANKSEKIAITLNQVEKLQQDLSTSTSQLTELQSRFEAQSNEIVTVRNELEKWRCSDANKTEKLVVATKDLEQLHSDLAISSSKIKTLEDSDTGKAEELAAVRNDLEKLHRDLSFASSQITEFQQRYAAQSSQLERSRESDATKTKELTAAGEKLEQLQHKLSTSSSRTIELQQRYEAQSTELSSLHEQFKSVLSRDGGKDGMVATLNSQIEQLQRVDAAKTEELRNAHVNSERLQRELSTSSVQIEELKKHYAAQLDALRNSTVVSEESREIHETMMKSEVRDYTAIIQLTTTVDGWLRADAKRAEELTRELERRNKENEELCNNLMLLKEIYLRAPELRQIFQSQTIEIQRRYEEQSRELETVLAERQSQLDTAQHFVVTTADTHADATIIQMLQKLNAEVQQNTTFMAEYMLEGFRVRGRGTRLTEEQVSAMQRVSESIGQTLVGCLGRKERDNVALYLPIAFQAYLTYHLCGIISSWTIEKGYNKLIDEAYQRLQKSGEQSDFVCELLLTVENSVNRGSRDIRALAIFNAHLHLADPNKQPERPHILYYRRAFRHCGGGRLRHLCFCRDFEDLFQVRGQGVIHHLDCWAV